MGRRMPVVAGAFYPGARNQLLETIERCFKHELGPGRLPSGERVGERRLLALVSPHAGYVYSGPIASHGFLLASESTRPDTVIVLGPNHQGIGAEVSVYPEGKWVTPLGEVEVDHECAYSLAESSDIFSIDESSHRYEHSIEVQLPFLQYVLDDFKLVAVCMLNQEKKASVEVGKALGDAARERNLLLIASSDLTHYEPASTAREKDGALLSAIKAMDVDELYGVTEGKRVSACGYGPVAASLVAAKKLGVEIGSLLKYATSGDVSGDQGSVVGYSSVAFQL